MNKDITPQQKLNKVAEAYKDIVWMAIRYAHGRHTYAPGMVRHSVKVFKEVFPDWELKEDKTIEPPTHYMSGLKDKSDYLHDLFKKNENTNR